MASSVVGSFIARYATLAFATKPAKLWFDGVPLKDGTTAVTLPTVELIDEGTVTEYDFEENPIEVTSLALVVRAVTLAAADAIAAGLRYNDGAVTAGLGFDFCALTITGQTCKEVRRLSERRTKEASVHDPEGKPVHKVEMKYRVMTVRTA